MAVVYLGLGSNMGNRVANLAAAIEALAPSVAVDQRSSIYETMPAYLEDQPRFANMVVRARTDLEPSALLRHAKAVEHELGRQAGPRNGPRPADVDILLYDALVLDTAELTIPHPRMLERSFVLTPLAEIAPELLHPVARERLDRLLANAGPLLGEITGRLDTSARDLAAGFLYHARSGKVLLHLRGTDQPMHPGKWAFFGGRAEPGDADLRATWCREMQEELGVTIDPAHAVSLSEGTNEDGSRWNDFYCAWQSPDDEFALTEGQAYAWFTIDEAIALPNLAEYARADLRTFRGLPSAASTADRCP